MFLMGTFSMLFLIWSFSLTTCVLLRNHNAITLINAWIQTFLSIGTPLDLFTTGLTYSASNVSHPYLLNVYIGAETYKIGLIGSMYFAGWTASCLFVPRLADIYGRKWVTLISSWFSAVVYLGIILSRKLELTIALFFFLGTCTTGKSSTAYVYLLEFIPENRVTWVATAMLFADGSTMIMLSIYFRFISKHWIYF